jgi:hypothetical protein
MLQLKKSMEGENFIAKEMSKYLPNKTNKQMSDKKAEKTYRKRLQEMRAQQTNNEDVHYTEQGIRDGSTLGDEGGGSSVTSPPGDIRERDPTINRGHLGTIQVDDIPEISISDYSYYVSERETAWRDIFRNTIDSHKLQRILRRRKRDHTHGREGINLC